MSTIIYPSPIFGPIHSRRLGVSLGINLLPEDGKFCTFDCVYCECGYNADNRPKKKLPSRKEVREALEKRLIDMKNNGPSPDVLTFAGNVEPPSHPSFPEIIDDVIGLRNRYFPNAKVSNSRQRSQARYEGQRRPRLRQALSADPFPRPRPLADLVRLRRRVCRLL